MPAPLPPIPLSTTTSARTPAPPPRAPKSEYILTDTGNKISRRSQIHGTANIILGGRTVIQASTVIRGDLVRPPAAGPPSTTPTTASTTSTSTAPAAAAAGKPTVAVSVGRYTVVGAGSVLRPAVLSAWASPAATQATHTPLQMGAHTYVGPQCVIEAAAIGSHVHVGAGSVVGKLAIVKDRVRILPGTVVPAGMVVASGSVVAGRPGRVVGGVGEGWGVGTGEVEGGEGRERWRGVG